jgi:ABC-type polar amino acid transport system ATPase subunit
MTVLSETTTQRINEARALNDVLVSGLLLDDGSSLSPETVFHVGQVIDRLLKEALGANDESP